MTVPRCQMSGQIYKIANQSVTPQVPPFLHACHALMHTLRHSPTCHRQPGLPLSISPTSHTHHLTPPTHCLSCLMPSHVLGTWHQTMSPVTAVCIPCTQHQFEWSQQPRSDGRPVMDHCVGRHASCLDDAVELAWVADSHPWGIMWEADMPPAGVCTAAALSLATLDKSWLGHSIQDEVCV